MHSKTKKNDKKSLSLSGLFFIGLIFIIIFFIGGNVPLLKEDIFAWPKSKAKVISIKHDIVCENPERSSACYPVFFISFSYCVNDKEYINQIEQLYATDYSTGKTFNVYYTKDNPQLVFPEDRVPSKLKFYFPLIIGLTITIPIIILWTISFIQNFRKILYDVKWDAKEHFKKGQTS